VLLSGGLLRSLRSFRGLCGLRFSLFHLFVLLFYCLCLTSTENMLVLY
jgi:hypothetical protein